jgi:hypothetical protein
MGAENRFSAIPTEAIMALTEKWGEDIFRETRPKPNKQFCEIIKESNPPTAGKRQRRILWFFL